MDAWLQDLRAAWRGLTRSRTMLGAAVFSLALGMGANCAIFSVVDAVLLRPLPFPHSERLLRVFASAPARGLAHTQFSFPRFTALAESGKSFAAVGAFSGDTAVLTGSDEPVQLNAARVSVGFFDVLGGRAERGRLFLAGEDRKGAAAVAVLGHALWRDRFGADPGLVGRDVLIDGQSTTVVGVLPAAFAWPGAEGVVDVWLPRPFESSSVNAGAVERGASYLDIVVRLRPDRSPQQAQAELDALAKADPRTEFLDAGFGYLAMPLREDVVRGARATLWLLSGAVGLVLLIACANVANLLLARAVGRSGEMAVRTALGAAHGRLIRQLMIESLLLASCAAVVGLALAWIGMRLLVPVASDSLPRAAEIGFNGQVLAVTGLLALVTSLIFGLAPAWRAARADLGTLLGSARRGTTRGRGQRRAGGALVVVEVALAVVLLVGAGLLVRSFARLRAVDVGFALDRLTIATVNLSPAKYSQPDSMREFYRRLEEDLATLPGVVAVGAAQEVPLTGAGGATLVAVDGRPLPPLAERAVVGFDTVSPGFFRALGIPLLGGRVFGREDNAGAGYAVVVNRSFAKAFFPGEDAVGKRLVLGRTPTPREIIGVVGDVRQAGLQEAPKPAFYLCSEQRAMPSMSVFVRTAGSPATGLGAAIRSRVATIDHDQPVGSVRSMREVMVGSLASRALTLFLFGLFALLALVLALTGVYAVLAHSVGERTREIGVRMAVGAERGDILRLLLGSGVGMASIGVALGLAAAAGLTRLLRGLLYDTGALDPLTFSAVALSVLGVAALASYLPARRAMRVDPSLALREG